MPTALQNLRDGRDRQQAGKQPPLNATVVAGEPTVQNPYTSTGTYLTTQPKPTTKPPFRSTAAWSPQDYQRLCDEAVVVLCRAAASLQAGLSSVQLVGEPRTPSSLTSASGAVVASVASSAAPAAKAPANRSAPPDTTSLIDLLTTSDMQRLDQIEQAMQRARVEENGMPRFRGLVDRYVGVAIGLMEGNTKERRVMIGATHKFKSVVEEVYDI